MILYTPIAEEEVLQGLNELNQREYIEYGGRLVSVMKTADGSYTLQQLLSTNPNDYMSSHFFPGNVL